MPLDFDELREKEDRSFKIAGETFVIRRLRPEAMDDLEAMQDAYLEIKDPTYAQLIEFAESRLKVMIDTDGQVERWEALRAKEDDPIEFSEIVAASRHAFQVVSGFPTLPSTPSTGGGGKPVTSSAAESS